MSLEIKAHTAFLSSPGDVTSERAIFARVLFEINRIYLTATGNIIWPIMWEDMVGGIGTDAQDVINRQSSDYDIFVGVVWSRFGSPTKRAGSGTEEEFLNALMRYRETDSSVDFMVFVKTADLPQNVDLDQWQKLKSFIERLKKSGILYHSFRDEKEFEILARRHVLAYLAKQTQRPTQKILRDNRSTRESEKTDDFPAREILVIVNRFSIELGQAISLLSSNSKQKKDAGRQRFRDATVDLLSEGGICIQGIIDWTYLYGRTCYSELVELCTPQERERLLSELGEICDQVVEWRKLLSKAPLIDAGIDSEFATAREFMDYCICSLQTSIYGLTGRIQE